MVEFWLIVCAAIASSAGVVVALGQHNRLVAAAFLINIVLCCLWLHMTTNATRGRNDERD